MITLIFIVISLVVTGALLKMNSDKLFTGQSYERRSTWKLFTIILTGIAMVIFSIAQPFSLERVDAGHVGIKVNLAGDERGVSSYEYKTGWVVLNDWFNRLYEFPTYQQHIEYPEQNVISLGGFSAVIKPSFNYSLNAGDVGDMFSNLRLSVKEIEQGWLQTAIVGTVNDVANRWPIDSIFNHREQFESEIVVEANKRVSKWFNVSQLRTNIVPPPSLEQSIIAKTKAIQDAQAAYQQALVADARAQEKIATAKGDSAYAVIQAAGRAEAIKKEQLNLTPLYLEYRRIQEWDGKLPQTLVTDGKGTLLNIGSNSPSSSESGTYTGGMRK